MYNEDRRKAISDMGKLCKLIKKKKLHNESTSLDRILHMGDFLRGLYGASLPLYSEQSSEIIRLLRQEQESPYICREMRDLMQSISFTL